MHIYIETFGCTANQSDYYTIDALLKKHKHTLSAHPQKADILIILTCTVIATTEQRMLSRIKKLDTLSKTLIVAGCMPAVQPQLILRIAPDAILLPPNKIHELPQILQSEVVKEIPTAPITKTYTTISAPISIAEGCNQNCSYCITRVARGKLKIKNPPTILNEIQQAIDQNCKEIYLTAQDTAAYYTPDRTHNLGTLLQTITQLPGDYFIRVGMMNPTHTKKHLTDIIQAYHSPHIYKFLHLPLQSGNNSILKKMNRTYTIETYQKLLATFKAYHPNLTLSTDIIVGFPNETTQQFQDTMNLLKSIEPDIVNITRFSPRPQTTAQTMSGRIPTDIMKERSRQLTKFCHQLTLKKNQIHLHKQYDIMITKNPTSTQSLGRTISYKPVLLNQYIPIGTHQTVNIYDADSIHLYGKLK